jgi:DNA-binding beta-propeller fold protein YncE
MRLTAGIVTSAVLSVAAVLAPAAARGADSVYWAWATLDGNSVTASGISLADRGGSGGHGLAVSGAPVDHPLGVAIDAATGMIYWTDFGSGTNYCTGALNGGDTISFSKLDGTGGGTLNTTGTTVSGPDGLAIDPRAGRLYWANDHANSISYANLDGSGGHDLNTTGATVKCPAGIAVDPSTHRVYWTNFTGNSISYANLDGSGGGDLPIASATVSGPYGLAIDSATGKLFWANNAGNTIGYANLDGSAGDLLDTPGAPLNGPWGVAIDPAAGLIYWANNLGNSIAYAALDESGGGALNSFGAPVDHPKYPSVLESPSGAGAPVVAGGSTTGSRLSCSPGAWSPDLPESFLYRAPQSVAYSWSKDGAPIDRSSRSIVPSSPGSYVCNVTASNYAGSGTQSSAAVAVVSNAVSVISRQVSNHGAITLGVLVQAPGTLRAVATCVLTTVRSVNGRSHRQRVTRPRTIRYGTAALATTSAGTFGLTITPTRAAFRLLKVSKRLTVRVALEFAPTNGTISRLGLTVPVAAPTGP